MTLTLLITLFAVVFGSITLISVIRKRGPRSQSLRGRFSSWLSELLNPKPKVTAFDAVSEFSTVEELNLDSHQNDGTGNIKLGYYVDSKKGTVDMSRPIYSDGDTPVGILGGGTGSWKTSTLLAEAALRHGRDVNGRVLQWRTPHGQVIRAGAPLLLLAPKPELIQIALRGRLAQGRVQIWVPDGPALQVLPAELTPYLANWTPLSECQTWDGAQAMGEATTAGTTGSGVSSGAFWEGSAARLVAAAMLCVVQRGSGGTLFNVYDALTVPKTITYVDDDGNSHTKQIEPLAALHGELTLRLSTWLAVAKPSPALTAKIDDTQMAVRAIADLAISQAGQTNSSIVTTAATALSSTLRAGTPAIAWDDKDAIKIEEMLVDSSGTVAVVGTPSGMRATRPLVSAFAAAVKRHLETRAFHMHRGRLERQVLVLIDELPVIMGAGEVFGEWAATARSQAVQIVYATQDLSSLDGLWGVHLRNKTINNTSDRLFYPSIADPETLKLGELLAGEHEVESRSVSTATSSGKSNGESSSSNSGTSSTVSVAKIWRPLMPAGRLARIKPGESVLVGPGRASQLGLVQWFNDPMLKILSETGQPPVSPPRPPHSVFVPTPGLVDDYGLAPLSNDDVPAWVKEREL